MYLTISHISINAVLLREEDEIQKPIFFTSRTLSDPETRYFVAEKLVLALIHTKEKLWHYFESHRIIVVASYPFKVILSKPDIAGRNGKEAMSLSTFDIQYKPRTSKKGQVFADFLLECEPSIEDQSLRVLSTEGEEWFLFIDGWSNNDGAGIDLHLKSLKGIIVEDALRNASNNEAEYEAFIAGLKLAIGLQIKHLKVYIDSALVASQLSGEFASKDDRMTSYLALAKNLAQNFENITLQ